MVSVLEDKRETEFTVRGWPAVAIILIAATLWVSQRVYLHGRLQVDPQVRSSIESTLQLRLYREFTDNGKALERATEAGDRASLEAMGNRIASASVEVHDLAMRGGDEEIVVRATYTVRTSERAKTETGYFLFTHSVLTGWTCHYEVSKWRWHLELF